jgi:hypothetical protein
LGLGLGLAWRLVCLSVDGGGAVRVDGEALVALHVLLRVRVRVRVGVRVGVGVGVRV